MKKLASLLLTLSLCLSIFACAPVREPEASAYSFTDDLGRSVSIHSTERVASLLGSFADMWELAGGSLCAAAEDAFEDFSIKSADTALNLGSPHRPSMERLIESAPTFVLASSKLSRHLELREALEGMGIAVAYFDVGDFSDFLRVFKLMTELTGKSENYEKYGTKQEKLIAEAILKAEGREAQTVLVMRASAASIRAKRSDDTVLGGMLRDYGCINVADSRDSLLDSISVESVILSDPDRIFFIETGADSQSVRAAVENMFAENPLWQELSAVKNGKVHFMDGKLYNLKPNARFAEAYLSLEKLLYED